MQRRDLLKQTALTLAAFSFSRDLFAAEAEKLTKLPDVDKIIRLGSNENPHGPSPASRKAMMDAVNGSNRYPWDVTTKLREEIGALTGQEQGRRLSLNLIIASVPIVIIGLSFGDIVKAYLFNAVTVAIALIVGGFVILWAERRPHQIVSQEVEDLTFKQATLIGLIQCLALIPGTSRSGSTIIGSLFLGISRKAAAEFSFFLGIPVLMGAGLLDMYKMRHELHSNDMAILAVGIIVAFVSALIVIRALIRYVSKHDFTAFAYYRIVFGLFILATWWTGWVHW